MKIVFLGDSLTWGGYGGNFVTTIAANCPQDEIINEGHGGNTVINLLRRLDDVLAHNPDGIFVMVGGNDAISNIYPPTRPYYKKVQSIPDGQVTLAQFERAYRDLLTQIQLAHVLVWVSLPPAEYSPELIAEMQRYNTIAKQLTRTLNIETLDFMAYFDPGIVHQRPPLGLQQINLIGERSRSGWADYERTRQHDGYTFTFDGLHMMPDTAVKMAEMIIDLLELHCDR